MDGCALDTYLLWCLHILHQAASSRLPAALGCLLWCIRREALSVALTALREALSVALAVPLGEFQLFVDCAESKGLDGVN